jgi:hypothetical protein
LVGIKQILIVEGNVDDIYERNGKYINMHNLFNEILGDKGYHKRFKFDKFSGFNRLVNDEGRIDTFKSSDSIELFSRLQEILPNNDELVGVVVDYTNYIFSNDATSEEDQMALTALAKTLKEVNFDRKTEMAKAITKFLFGDENNLIRFDMSEYGTENADQKLIGAPPGYVGFEGGGQLTNAVKAKPFSVVLFDEIEKANPKIFDKFLQILEDGRLTDNTGKTVSFSETIIIFTSNIGAAVVNPDDDEESVRRNFISKVQEYFSNELNRPEILGRIGNNIVPFAFIKNAELQNNLSVQKIKQVLKRVEEKYLITFETKFDDKFLKYVLKDADVKRGGRDIINSIEINFIDPLTTFIFENKSKLQAGVTIMVSYTTKLIFQIK